MWLEHNDDTHTTILLRFLALLRGRSDPTSGEGSSSRATSLACQNSTLTTAGDDLPPSWSLLVAIQKNKTGVCAPFARRLWTTMAESKLWEHLKVSCLHFLERWSNEVPCPRNKCLSGPRLIASISHWREIEMAMVITDVLMVAHRFWLNICFVEGGVRRTRMPCQWHLSLGKRYL